MAMFTLILLTKRKFARMLENDGPQLCAKKLGSKIYRPCIALASSSKEEYALRKLAIEAITHVKLSSKVDLRSFLNSLPNELRVYFFQTSFCNTATQEIKHKLIQVFSSHFPREKDKIPNETMKPLRDDLRAWLESNSNASVIDFLVGCLEDKNLDNDIKAECAPLIASKLGEDAISILIDALRRSDLGVHCILTNRILAGLNLLSKVIEGSMNKWQEPLEKALIEKVDEIISRLDDTNTSMIRGLMYLHYSDRFASHLDPEDRICRMLKRIGGKESLKAISRIFDNAQENKSYTQQPIFDPQMQWILQKYHTQSSAKDYLHLIDAAVSIYKRLITSGEITSSNEFPLIKEIMLKYRSQEKHA